MPLLASLHHRAFLFLWIGQTISRLGDQVYAIALAWWVLEKTHSATAMGTVLIVAFLPTLVFLLIGGAIADRLPRLAIMFASDIARAVLVAVIAVMAFVGYLPLWPIIIVSFCFGMMDAFFLPAYSAVIPQILPLSDLPSANSLRILSGRMMAIIGPAAGAALIAIGGTPIAFAINAASFAISAICLSAAIPQLRGVSVTAPTQGSQDFPAWRAMLTRLGQDLREGLATVGALRWVWLTIVIAGFANLIGEGAISIALPYYVQQKLHAPLIYGGLAAASAAGSILGAVWFGARKLRHRGWVIYGFFMANFLALTPIGMFPMPSVILGGMFIYGLCGTVLGLAWMTALQEYIPNEQMGRVTSVDQLGSYIGIPLSLGLAGVATDHIGALPLLTWGGLLAAAIVALGLCSHAVRTLD